MRFVAVCLRRICCTFGAREDSLALSCSRHAPVNLTDVIRVCWTLTTTQVIAVHMEALNHCFLSRAALGAAVPEVVIPGDGETVTL